LISQPSTSRPFVSTPSFSIPGLRAQARARIDATARLVCAAVAAFAGAQLVIYFFIAARTLDYPYPLESMEGGSVDVVDRVVRGLPIYSAPSPEYVPYIYTPLYYWVVALVARVVGVDFFAARLVSFAAIAMVGVFVWLLVRRESDHSLFALAAVGLFFGTFTASDRWFHVARVDSLFLMWLIAALYVLRRGSGVTSAVLAGALLWLAFATKQTALVCAAIALPVMALDSWRRPAIAAAAMALLVAASTAIMAVRTDGWFTFYVFRLTRDQGIDWPMLYRFWSHDIIKVMPLALVGLGAAIVGRGWRSRIWLLGACAGLIATSWLARANVGGAGNALMPAYAALAVAMPLGLARWWTTDRGRLIAAAALAFQLAMLLHRPDAAIPTAADRAAGDHFVSFLRGIDGDVVVFSQRFVPARAGKKSYGLDASAIDLLTSTRKDVSEKFRRDVVAELKSGRVAGVIDPPFFVQRRVKLAAGVTIFPSSSDFMTRAGMPHRPGTFYRVLSADSR
jgi:hypothetical protein